MFYSNILIMIIYLNNIFFKYQNCFEIIISQFFLIFVNQTKNIGKYICEILNNNDEKILNILNCSF